MDGIHDLGGRQGFGPVDHDETEENFHAAWEARMMGLVRAMTRPADWSTDWFRHCRELIDPVDYLTRPYFDQWMQAYAAMLVNSGVATVEEIATGRAVTPGPGLGRPMPPEAVAQAKAVAPRFDRSGARAPLFAPGDAVRARRDAPAGHTRLPGYVRGRCGTIHAVRGTHVLPDRNAYGEAVAAPLYSVVFEAAELWPEAAGRRDRVFLDLWESHLEHG